MMLWYTIYGEHMNRIVIKIVLIIYFLLALGIVFYLLSLNDLGFSQIGKYTLFYSDDNKSLIISKKDSKRIKIGDEIYFYNVYTSKSEIISSRVTEINITNEKEITFKLENNLYLSSSYLIGRKADRIEIYFLGFILKFLSQKLVYLSIFIIPIFICLIYQFKHLNTDIFRK